MQPLLFARIDLWINDGSVRSTNSTFAIFLIIFGVTNICLRYVSKCSRRIKFSCSFDVITNSCGKQLIPLFDRSKIVIYIVVSVQTILLFFIPFCIWWASILQIILLFMLLSIRTYCSPLILKYSMIFFQSSNFYY